jgi:hypothetical protein
MAQHPPQGRVFATGGMRFRMNSWFDIPQVGGGFDTGLRNRVPWDLAYNIRSAKDSRPGHETQDALLELKAMGTEYVVVHGPRSREYYRDFVRPERVSSALPAVYREEDDIIYALPARPLANLLNPEELPGKDAPARPWVLEPYIAALEDPARPAFRTRWLGADTLAIDGVAPPGRLVAVRVNADPGWQAFQDGRAISIEIDNLGFMVLRPAAAAATHLLLHYRATAEPRFMAALSALSWMAALAALFLCPRKNNGHG